MFRTTVSRIVVVTTRLGTTNVKRFVNRGTPLWNAAMNIILLSLEEVGVKVVGYADDLTIAIRAKFLTYFREPLILLQYGDGIGEEIYCNLISSHFF